MATEPKPKRGAIAYTFTVTLTFREQEPGRDRPMRSPDAKELATEIEAHLENLYGYRVTARATLTDR